MLSSTRITCCLTAFLLLGLLGVSAPSSATAQDVRGAVIVDNPPEALESGSLLDLFAAFRTGEHQIHLEFESDADVVPVQFQTIMRKDGETLGRSRRDPMPYFPGDMLMCPEAWGFIAMLNELADDEGQLPPGDYEVLLVAENVEGEAGIEPAEFQFTVPRR